MTELSEILLLHAKKYPKMQPCDAVKLIYQNEFGAGHFIANEALAFERLKNEYSQCEKRPNAELFEDIGNGICRVNLAALNLNEYPLEKLFADFVGGSKAHKGSQESFLQKLTVLDALAKGENFSFTYQSFCEYISEYKSKGYPATSHSEEYKAAYKPAYRIIKRDL